MPQSNSHQSPKCPYGNDVKYICINFQCRKSGIICDKGEITQSQCWLFHENCNKIKWNDIENFTKENFLTKTPQFIILQQKIETIFLKSLGKIQYEHEKFRIWTKTFGYNLQTMKFIKNLMDKNYQLLTGQYMSNILSNLANKENKRIIQTPVILQTDFQFVKAEIDRVLEKISGLYLKMKKIDRNVNLEKSSAYVDNSGAQGNKNSQLTFSTAGGMKTLSNLNNYLQKDNTITQFKSKIVDNFGVIQPFFENKKVKSATLIYRASQNNFSIKKFHELCDKIPDTLTLIHNQFGKKIGGYTPVAWTSDKKHWVADKSLTSFIFSLDMNQRFKLNLAQFAIASNPERGPTFGCCDVCIVDNSNKLESNCEFPISYNNNGKYIRSQATSIAFTGHAKGQFLIKDWQVFKIQFQ